jgi:NADPH:quinone reductase-like Zn-dependent oxidoreductase
MIRSGTYPAGQPAFPLTLGYECVGTVEKLGDSVEPSEWGYKVGSRVAVLSTTGCWADFVVANRDEVFPIPENVDGPKAAALVMNCTL